MRLHVAGNQETKALNVSYGGFAPSRGARAVVVPSDMRFPCRDLLYGAAGTNVNFTFNVPPFVTERASTKLPPRPAVALHPAGGLIVTPRSIPQPRLPNVTVPPVSTLVILFGLSAE